MNQITWLNEKDLSEIMNDIESVCEGGGGYRTPPGEMLQLADEHRILRETYKRLRRIVDEQADDPVLWIEAKFIAEAHLQQELRRLHAEIEK